MEQIPNWFYRISAKALILDEDKKFLLVREEKWWELPWWWLEYWESPQEWIRRELYEEMWINVIRINKKPSYFITTQKDNWIWIAKSGNGFSYHLNKHTARQRGINKFQAVRPWFKNGFNKQFCFFVFYIYRDFVFVSSWCNCCYI